MVFSSPSSTLLLFYFISHMSLVCRHNLVVMVSVWLSVSVYMRALVCICMPEYLYNAFCIR